MQTHSATWRNLSTRRGGIQLLINNCYSLLKLKALAMQVGTVDDSLKWQAIPTCTSSVPKSLEGEPTQGQVTKADISSLKFF